MVRDIVGRGRPLIQDRPRLRWVRVISSSERVYASFRPGGDALVERLNSFVYTRRAGLDLWSGFLVGLGETADDCALGIELLRAYGPLSVSILAFEPYPDTPMADHPPCDPSWLARVVRNGRCVEACVCCS